MATIIRMPKMSDTMVEGVIAAWHKKVGDSIKSGDILADVETDKATMELESYESGTLLYLGVAVRQAVPINGILAIIGKADEDITHLLTEHLTPTPSYTPIAMAQPAESAISQPPSNTPTPLLTSADQSRTLVSPLAKKMAHLQGYDLTRIQGTGDGGRIIKRDIEKLAMNQPPYPTNSPYPTGQEAYELIPVSQIRKTIAKRLTDSMAQAPHFYLQVAVNMDKVVEFRTNILTHYTDVKITFNDIIIKATAHALRHHPHINTAWLGDTIRYNQHIHIGVAMAVSTGLVVPLVRFADQLSLSQIAANIKNVSQKAHNNQLTSADCGESTFTISNLGMLEIESFTAIINPPASCILAIGAIKNIPIVKEGTIVPGHVMQMTLSCDHRVVDGAIGAAFLRTLTQYLEEPLQLLI